MSSLWVEHTTKNNKNKPSPANIKVLKKKPLSQIIKQMHPSIERISLLASRHKASRLRAGMTVEAALLLPLFLFFFLHLAGVMEMLRLHGKLEAALWNAGNQMVLYTDTFSEEMEDLPDVGISYLPVNDLIQSFLGKAYLEASPLVYGTLGLNYFRSEYLNEEDCVDILVTYQVKPPLSIFPFRYRRMSNRYYARAWTGYDVSVSKVEYVYVASRGEVWHSTPECSYIYHRVMVVWAGEVADRENVRGQRYEPCAICTKGEPDPYVFVTEEGQKYHCDRNCTAIYKDIRAIPRESAGDYRACSRCGP